MAYCAKCGAYIPDGQSKCLACGYDENAVKNENRSSGAANAAAKSTNNAGFDAEKLRRQLEEQRARQQENSRKWAEAERARRQQQEQRHGGGSSQDGIYSAPGFTRTADTGEVNDTSRRLGIISYLGALWLIPMIFFHDDKFAMYHAKQGLLLAIVAAVVTSVASAMGLGWVATVAHFYMIVRGIKNAKAGIIEPLPYIGNIISKF